MPGLPDHVRAKVTAEPAGTRSKSSPWRPYPTRRYRLPRAEWCVLFGPTLLFTVVLALSSLGPQGNADQVVLAVLMNVVFIVAAAWRVPQESRRSKARSWRLHSAVNTFEWDDPSGEWDYARSQSRFLNPLLRWLAALGMPATWFWAFTTADAHHSGWPFVALAFVSGALVYLHRHLPTTFRPADSVRCCEACGNVRRADTPRVCPRCGRVAEIVDLPALPALRRRWRDL
jgi:hypothetical protein